MKDYTQYTDEELLTMRENGEEEITEYLIEKYKPMVRQRVRVLYLVGGDQDDAIQMEKKIRQQLSKFENQVLELYLDGENYLEIAHHLGKTPKSIDNALQRIRGKVREYL